MAAKITSPKPGVGDRTEAPKDKSQFFPVPPPCFGPLFAHQQGPQQFKKGCVIWSTQGAKPALKGQIGQKLGSVASTKWLWTSTGTETSFKPLDACSSLPARSASLLQKTVPTKVRKASNWDPRPVTRTQKGHWQCPECHLLVPIGSNSITVVLDTRAI